MQRERQQCPWRIDVEAKAKNFNFRLRATSLAPNWTLSRFSIILKLRKFVFRFNSDSTTTIALQPRPGFLRTRVINVVQKFRARFTTKIRPVYRNRSASNIEHPKEPICTGIWVVWFLAFVAEAVWKKGQRGIIIVGCVGFMVGLLKKKYKRGRFLNMKGLWMVATIACFLLLDFHTYWEGGEACNQKIIAAL